MDGRSTSTDSYRYAYNGMEMDNEVSGSGNSYTTEFRQYDSRLGRWKSLDPLMGMFPHMSPYVAFDNNPVYFTDIYGLSAGGPGGEGANEGGGAGDKNPLSGLPNTRVLSWYKFDTDKSEWHGHDNRRFESDPEFKQLFDEIGKHANEVSNYYEDEYNLKKSRLRNDVSWGMNENANEMGYYLNLYYETSKKNRIKVKFLIYSYSTNSEPIYNEDGSLDSFKPELFKVSPEEIKESCISNCYAFVLGLIGYVEATEDVMQIFSDDYSIVDSPEVGDVAFSYGKGHAMLITGKKDGKLIYKSLWNGWGAIEEGTFDEIYERQFSTLNPKIKESDFIYLRKK